MTISRPVLIGVSLTAAIFFGAQSIPASAHRVGSHDAGPAASDTPDCEIVTGVPVPSDEYAFTPSELRQQYSGKTARWTHGAGYFAPDGTLEFIWKGKKGSGWWRIAEDGYDCLEVPAWFGNNVEKCYYRSYHDGDKIVIVNENYPNSPKDYLQPKSKTMGCYTEGNIFQ